MNSEPTKLEAQIRVMHAFASLRDNERVIDAGIYPDFGASRGWGWWVTIASQRYLGSSARSEYNETGWKDSPAYMAALTIFMKDGRYLEK